jgi:hypothetical protein
MSSLRTFIAALKTGETRTTKALELVVSRQRRAASTELVDALAARGAFNTPLQKGFRQALRKAPLPERNIEQCIDGWPDAQKEQMRRAIASAIQDGRRVRFRWGLTAARTFATEINSDGAGAVTITALSPRSSLRVDRGNEVYVAPAGPAATRTSKAGRKTRAPK